MNNKTVIFKSLLCYCYLFNIIFLPILIIPKMNNINDHYKSTFRTCSIMPAITDPMIVFQVAIKSNLKSIYGRNWLTRRGIVVRADISNYDCDVSWARQVWNRNTNAKSLGFSWTLSSVIIGKILLGLDHIHITPPIYVFC